VETSEPVWIILGRNADNEPWQALQVTIGRRQDAVDECAFWTDNGYRVRVREGTIALKKKQAG